MAEPGEPVLATPLPPESPATAVDSAPAAAGGGANDAAAVAAGEGDVLPGAATAKGGALAPADGDVGRREAEPGVGATPAWGRTG